MATGKRLFWLTARGCDDTNRVIVALTDAERDAVATAAQMLTAASEFACQPRLYLAECRDARCVCGPDGDGVDPDCVPGCLTPQAAEVPIATSPGGPF